MAFDLGGKQDFSHMLSGAEATAKEQQANQARMQFGELADCVGFGPEVSHRVCYTGPSSPLTESCCLLVLQYWNGGNSGGMQLGLKTGIGESTIALLPQTMDDPWMQAKALRVLASIATHPNPGWTMRMLDQGVVKAVAMILSQPLNRAHLTAMFLVSKLYQSAATPKWMASASLLEVFVTFFVALVFY